MARRSAALALLSAALPMAAGCRAMNDNPASRIAPPATRTSGVAQEVVARINRDARAVENFRAEATVTVSGRIFKGASVHGLMAMERPRRFRMTLLNTAGVGRSEVADLGSDGQAFWFAVAEDKTMFTGQYDPDGNLPVGVPLPMQPDWIVEALGLKEISAEDVAAMRVARTRNGLLELTLRRQTADGQAYVKAILVDEARRQVVEYQLRDAKGVLLARAQIREYQRVAAPADDADDGSSRAEPVLFPKRIVLSWAAEGGMRLDAQIDRPAINQALPEQVFQQPDKRAEGYAYRAVGGDAGSYARAPATVRETRPAPVDGPVQLGEPVPLDDGAMRAVAPGEPAPYSPDLRRLPEPEAVVGARIEQAPGTLDVPASTAAEALPTTAPRRPGRLFGLLR